MFPMRNTGFWSDATLLKGGIVAARYFNYTCTTGNLDIYHSIKIFIFRNNANIKHIQLDTLDRAEEPSKLDDEHHANGNNYSIIVRNHTLLCR